MADRTSPSSNAPARTGGTSGTVQVQIPVDVKSLAKELQDELQDIRKQKEEASMRRVRLCSNPLKRGYRLGDVYREMRSAVPFSV
jgi:hypothetical protein